MLNTFTIYRSSAGSGKTRTLAKEYLKLALRSRSQYYRHILAVTFTNKATQEMKDRILAYLDEFAQGKPGLLAQELKEELKLDDSTFQQYAQETQSAILHGYSDFSISTIDAFFQRVIRSFTREAGLVGDYRLEIDQDIVMEEVIDNLIDELGPNKELTNWVIDFARENLENERAWDVRQSLLVFSKEIFREEFRFIEDEVAEKTSDPAYFKNLKKTLWKIKNDFLKSVSDPASDVIDLLNKQTWGHGDVKYGSNSGLNTFLNTFAYKKELKEMREIKDRIRTLFTDPSSWCSHKSPHAASIHNVAKVAAPKIQQIIDIYDAAFTAALSADLALQNLYVFGLVADIARKLKEYKEENNLMLLADSPKFLNGVIQDSDTPFIYEKVGSFYRNYLIDEFQDTSGLQWKNFLPLLSNSLDQGFTSLVVGDVKQAIYRWRGGDLKLLQHDVEKHIGKERVAGKILNTNFRSSAAIVNFNNLLFTAAAKIVTELTGGQISADAYVDVAQDVSKGKEGFVRIKFFTEEKDGPTWKNQAMDHIPVYLELLQSIGVSLNEIAILVRKNEEGQQIINHLLNYKNSDAAKPEFRYDVVSNESLRIDSAATVSLLEGAMKYLLNPTDDIARAQLAFEFARLFDPERVWTEVFAVTNQSIFESYLPADFTKEKASLKKLPLFELTETLIRIFRLGEQQGELAYLQAFQNLVLDFYTREKNDLGAFLEWWLENKHKKSVPVSGKVDAAQIITVHKSKGLQFKYVLIPFCSWPVDHDSLKAPNLWVTSNEKPFDDAGFLPVKYVSTLQKTYFANFYNEEHTRSYLDNLNLLYVALTRAESGMIVFAPDDNAGGKKSIAHILQRAIVEQPGFVEAWNVHIGEYNAGSWSVVPNAVEVTAHAAISLSNYSVSNWRDKLVIRQTARNIFDEPAGEKQHKINYGIHMHTVLSRINDESEIKAALDTLLHEGYIEADERQDLTSYLLNLLKHDQIRSWFQKGWDVRTEVPILLPDGSESRIDRLLVRDKKAIVIDFKTGEPTTADHHQVTHYLQILRQMNFIEVEGYLLYVRTGEVVSISPARTRVVKKKDDTSQLDLGL